MATVLAAAMLGIAANTSAFAAFAFDAKGSSGSRAAEAGFDVVGGRLQVTLLNTSSQDVLAPGDVLTAIFFDIKNNPKLTSVSAVLGVGSKVAYGPDGQPSGGVVGGEWGLANGLSGAPLGAKKGISSSGLGGLFSAATFTGPNLAGPSALDGVQYGILSAGDDIATGNGGITGSGGLIKNSVVFTLSGLPAGFDVTRDISKVTFQYGTGMTEPRFAATAVAGSVAVPEPSTCLAGILMLLPFAVRTLRCLLKDPTA